MIKRILKTDKKEIGKSILIQVIRGWNHRGRVLLPGARVVLEEMLARKVIRLGFATEVDIEAPYEYPAENPEHAFKRVEMESDSPKIETIEFLQRSHIAILHGVGIKTVDDLAEWTLEKLEMLNGISKRTAERLIEFIYNKDSGMEMLDK